MISPDRLLMTLAFLALAAAEAPADGLPPGGEDFFERRVRPVIAEHCLGCHGPTAAKGGLRLDSREALLKGSDAGPVVVTGEPDESPLVEAVRRDGPLKMPPKTPLSPAAVTDIEDWVRMGLPWPAGKPVVPNAAAGSSPDDGRDHWAFRPIRGADAPAIKGDGEARTSVDSFVIAALEAKGLGLSPEADRRTLVRRATFDLLGLPPTPEEVAAFEADDRPGAYESLVDRLLASPHYGERWGRHWLDVARYADTKGYVLFQDAEFTWAYTYRDWVVGALNADLPYDRFLIEQLAADRLPSGPGRSRAQAALGFLTLGGRFMDNSHDIIDDRIDVATRGLMGLTVSCARCHDHKFDPIPQSDYYALYGVFATAVEPAAPPLLDEPPDTPEYRKFDAELKAREAKLAAFVAGKHADLVASARSRAGEYLLAAQAATDRPNTGEFMLLADGGDLNPTMVIRWQSFLERSNRRRLPVMAAWHALAALSQSEGDFAPLAAKLVGDWLAEPGPVNLVVLRTLAETPPRSMADVAEAYGKALRAAAALGEEHDRRAALEGRAPGPLPVAAYQELREVMRGPDAPPDVPAAGISRLELLPDRGSQATLQELQKAVVTWRATGPGAPPRAMSVEDLPTPVEPRVFLRGNPNNLGPPVPRRSLTLLAGPDSRPFTDGGGRLELAGAIASPDNPLTARVLVNRVWMHHMGEPLVDTPGDFGLRSEPPTHPELLDHLADLFMRQDGWGLKALHRRVMLSAAYRQSSADRPEARAADPENALYWRANRRRLEFESLRDALLAASGRLAPTFGGPPVAELDGANSVRRTLYGKIDRLNLPGLFRAFDFPDPNASNPRRDATTVAPQALFLMNHPFLHASARAMTARPDVAALASVKDRVDRLHRLAFARPPGPDELALALEFVEASGGGWERYAQALLLSNEFAFVD